MVYGDKRDYPKLDIYVNGEYKASTTWARNAREAKEKYWQSSNVAIDQIKVFKA